MIQRKPDSDEIRAFLASLADQSWLRRTERRWWPQFVFHYTDLANAAKILSDGYLYSRRYLEERNQLPVDSGSPVVLAGTAESIKAYVRLYFRPQTPTQFHAEGIRAADAFTELQAHCPTPVFFLFDSTELLTRADCRFSDGTLASPSARLLSTAAELRTLPWSKIYHTGPFDRSRQSESDITFRRNAEIIIPERLDLSGLRYIYCRSEAEKETLLHLLSSSLRRKYQSHILSTTRSMLFFRQYTFVESASLSSDAVLLRFSPDSKSPGPFHAVVRIEDSILNRRFQWEKEDFHATGQLRLGLRTTLSEYIIQVELDRHLAYANSYEEIEIPF